MGKAFDVARRTKAELLALLEAPEPHEEDIPPRPREMHRKKYVRYVARGLQLEEAQELAYLGEAAAIVGMLPDSNGSNRFERSARALLRSRPGEHDRRRALEWIDGPDWPPPNGSNWVSSPNAPASG